MSPGLTLEGSEGEKPWTVCHPLLEPGETTGFLLGLNWLSTQQNGQPLSL